MIYQIIPCFSNTGIYYRLKEMVFF
jgi:hypothetical protein